MSGLKVAIIGMGGREHALLWVISRSPMVQHTFLHEYVGPEETIESLIVGNRRPDFVVVGPEAPLVAGLVDRLEAIGIPAFGPSAAAAMLEGSKVFMKEFCMSEGIPTAPWAKAETYAEACHLIDGWSSVPVVKADGLCAGKGVLVARNRMLAKDFAFDCMVNGRFGREGSRVVIEDRLHGTECSMMFLCQDETALPLPPARDYKRARDGDKGKNTGGMGAYSPPPDVNDALIEEVQHRIILSTLRAMKARGTPFRGILYAGLILTAKGPLLLEFNVRFGDPEAQAVLPRLNCDIVPYLLAIARNESGDLARLGHLAVKNEAAVCVTLACRGYPRRPRTGGLITDEGDLEHTLLFHAGVRIAANGQLYATGGRVASAVGLGSGIRSAQERAYARAGRVRYPYKYLRHDIATL